MRNPSPMATFQLGAAVRYPSAGVLAEELAGGHLVPRQSTGPLSVRMYFDC